MKGRRRAHQLGIVHAGFLRREERPFEMDAEHTGLRGHRRVDGGARRAHRLVGLGDQRGQQARRAEAAMRGGNGSDSFRRRIIVIRHLQLVRVAAKECQQQGAD